MPKIWSETIEAHRREVREAIMDATAALAEHGLLSLTMSQIAERSRIGRATLYKYFPDVEAILLAWHERQINAHLQELAEARDRASAPGDRLEAVLQAYASIAHAFHGHHDNDLAAFLHRDQHVGKSEQLLRDLLRDLLIAGADAGDVRRDVAPDELVSYCLHALTAAKTLPSEAAVRRLVSITLAGVRSPSSDPALVHRGSVQPQKRRHRDSR